MAYLIIVRHGESQWNAVGKWAGLTDVELTEAGKREAHLAARYLKDITLDMAYVSKLKRAKETLRQIQYALALSGIPVVEHEAWNERDYGKLTGLNKKDYKKKIGQEEYRRISRGVGYFRARRRIAQNGA